MTMSPTGDDVIFASAGGFADVDSLANLGIPYRARRTPTGWQTATLGNPPVSLLKAFTNGNVDVQRAWWQEDRPNLLYYGAPVEAIGDIAEPTTVFAGVKGGSWERITPDLESRAAIHATSQDLSSFIMDVGEKLTVPLSDGSEDTRQYTGNRSRVSLIVVKRNPDGTVDFGQVARENDESFLPTCSIVLGARGAGIRRGAVNRKDLSRVIFTVQGTGCTTPARSRVWAAEPFGESPDVVELSAPEPGCVDCNAQAVTFVGAALDTSRVYMTTTQKLLNEDTQTGTDIYEYDYRKPEGQRLSLVTGNSTPANVQGVLEVSADGSRIFFVATGVLDDAEHGETEPVEGESNLYVRMDDPDGGPPITRFIATLAAGDPVTTTSNRQGGITPDGRFFLFRSAAHLTDDKLPGDDFADAYRYDVDTGELLRIWTDDPAHNGTNRTAGINGPAGPTKGGQYANFEWQSASGGPISEDGSVIVFSTSEPLAPGDLNGVDDSFVWRADTGTIAMVSDGKDPLGVSSQFLSRDGSTVLFMTISQIVPQHTSTSQGLYVYRPKGGFPLPPAGPTPCDGDECQGKVISPPGLPDLGSTAFEGDGNLPPARRSSKPSVGIAKRIGVRGSTAIVKVRVPGAGRITIVGPALKRTVRSTPAAGNYRLAIRLKPRARKRLRKKSLRVKARVSYRTQDGRAASKTVRVAFKRLPSRRGGK